MRAITPALACLIALALATPALAAEGKIAIVDLQKVLQSVEAAKKAKKKLQGVLSKKQKALNDRQEALKKLKAEYESQSMLMKPEKKRAMEQQLQQGLMELQTFMMENQRELAQVEAQETGKIIQKVQGIVQVMAKKRGWALVLVNSGDNMLYAQPKLDVTNEVIRKFDAAK
jgi:outer membrane protein